MPLVLPFLSERRTGPDTPGGQYTLLPRSERQLETPSQEGSTTATSSAGGLFPATLSEYRAQSSAEKHQKEQELEDGELPEGQGDEEVILQVNGKAIDSTASPVSPSRVDVACGAEVGFLNLPPSREDKGVGSARAFSARQEDKSSFSRLMQGSPQRHSDEEEGVPLLQASADEEREASVQSKKQTKVVARAETGSKETSHDSRATKGSFHAKKPERKQLPVVPTMITVAVLASINLGIYYGASPKFKNPETKELLTWEPYMVLNGVMVSIVLLAFGLPADLLLLAFSSFFCVTRIISVHELLGGLSNEGVVAVGALCAVSAAIDKTKALNGIMGKALGSPSSASMGMIRLAIPLISLGSVFNNTPLVAVFIPIVKQWCAAKGLDVGHFMMPLSFMAMLSATLTTMGSSTNLLAVKLVPQAQIHFLDPAPVGCIIILTGVAYCTLFGPCLLPCAGTSEPDLEAKEKGSEDPEKAQPIRDKFEVHFKLAADGPLLGRSALETGMLNALVEPAVVRCTVGDGSKAMEAGERLAVINATAKEIMSLGAIPGLSLQSYQAWYRSAKEKTNNSKLLWQKAKKVQLALKFQKKPFQNAPDHFQEDDEFVSGIEGTSRMAMPVRRWIAAGMDGGWAEASVTLFKLVVPPGGPVGLETVSQDADSGATICRLQQLHRYLQGHQCTLVGMCGACPDENGNLLLCGGELLLVEAPAKAVSNELRDSFSLVIPVEEQLPPAAVRLSFLDPYRPGLAVLGLLSTVVFAAFDLAPLDAVAFLVALSSILLGTLSGPDLYRSINGPVLLTVAASFGFGAAIYNTGLATCLASGVLFLVEDYGKAAITGALVGLALVLGVFVSNNTVVILLAPLIEDICERRNLSLKMAMLSVIYAANLSFATPFSYQTNMMVMPHGKYVFIDYIKFGLPMMIICGIVALGATLVYWG
eukprot:TRINITY_DN33523_c0_g1_i1.p1 TRINITY_DN33523_c0_g1~~TRINITY_DN33523_c0_g1_i1.p1  ORF type:complete len:933 (+),score=203.28 TRINITY_DN33523_c0_g1_i1:59-2857(+)